MKSRLHPDSYQQLEYYLQQQPHAIIITGLSQAARTAVTEHIQRELTTPDQIRLITSDKASISIAQIKALIGGLYRRSNRPEPLLVSIPEAHKLTLPAQNALLKLLEEPPLHVKFVLAAPAPDSLLATIQSRSQQIRLHPLSETGFSQVVQTPDTKTNQLYAVTAGDPFLAQQLTEDEAALKVVQLSLHLLQAPLGQAMAELTSELKQGLDLDLLMAAWRRIARLGLERADNKTEQLRWLHRLQSVSEASEHLKSQLNPKLTLDQLLLEFRAS